MPLSLTPRASQLLTFIQGYMAAHDGLAPSYEDMRAGIGEGSKGGIGRLMKQLEDRNAIRRVPRRRRCIEVTIAPAITLPVDLYLEAHACANREKRSVNALAADAIRCWLDAEVADVPNRSAA